MFHPFSRTTAARGATLALAIGLATGANAQMPQSMDEIVITASGFEQETTNAPASISVISREKIEKRGYQDVTEALGTVPGVIITGGGNGSDGADISMRGFSSSYTMLMVDGRRVDGRQARTNGTSGYEQDWMPPMGAIERIEVIRGPMATRYGSDALGGVVNVITRKVPEQWGGSVETGVTYQENEGAGNKYQTSFNLGGPVIEDTLGLQVYGRHSRREEDEIVGGYEEKNLQNLNGRLSYTPTDNHDIILESGFTDQRRRRFVGESLPESGCRGGCSDSEDNHFRQFYALSHTGRWNFGTLDSHAQRETVRDESSNSEITNITADTSLMAPIGAHTLTLGADYRHESLDDEESNAYSDLTHAEQWNWALFIEDEWQLAPSFSLTGGLRYTRNENFDGQFSPRLYGVWNMAPQWTLKGGVTTGYHAPRLREITPDWAMGSRGGDQYGNPNLEPEESRNYEIGLHFNGDSGWGGGLTLFHNDFDNKIEESPCPDDPSLGCYYGEDSLYGGPKLLVNINEAITRGAEFSFSGPLRESLELSGTYTFTDSEQRSGDNKGNPLNQLPRHEASLSLDWQATQRLSPWVEARYVGEESQATGTQHGGSQIAPSYSIVDAGLTYDMTDRATLKTAVRNLANQPVSPDEYDRLLEGRRYWVALDLSF